MARPLLTGTTWNPTNSLPNPKSNQVVILGHMKGESSLPRTIPQCVGLFSKHWNALGYARRVGIPVALVISDIRMPGLSGIDVLRQIRESALDTPVLLISAFCDEETLGDADRFEATVVMSKPFEMEALVTIIDFLLLGNSGCETEKRESEN